MLKDMNTVNNSLMERGSMKRLLTVFAICLGMMLLAGCGGGGDSAGNISDNPGNVYRIIVTGESGEPVPDVDIQFCSDTICKKAVTDGSGITAFDDPEQEGYTVHILAVPEGYAEDDTEYEVPAAYSDVNITLKAE